MADARATNPLVEQFRRGAVPRDLRLIAAQGLLPLKPDDLLELWTDLLGDLDTEVCSAAQASLVGYPAAELAPVLKSRETPAAVLSWAAARRPERELRELALQNTTLPDETIEALAPTLSEALAELVVINQTRLLRRTSLLVALESNPSLNNDQRRRLRELRETFHVGEPSAAAPAAAPAPPVAAAAPRAPEPAVALAPEPEPEPELDAWLHLSEDEAVARILTPEERQQTEKVSAVQRIYRLNAAEKVIAALKSTREERAILIRDPNRIVAAAVLGSPKLTDAEVESFASMKNVSDQVLRGIGNHREWTKRYSVISNLVRNPRTPVGIALTLASRLNPKDLRGLSIDRNVSEAVRKHAQKFVKGAQK
jgi:hypothetical protein